MTVVATAGHVDHGKSTLVMALTGTDPDRWAEEKARGLTIDLGFAAMRLPSGRDIGFVDVPGHCRFVKNMLSGVGAVDACLFVVDSREGWKAQSEEHLRILDLLGIRRGLVALTKVAPLDELQRDAAACAVRERLQATFLSEAEVVAVDAVAGIGLSDLRAALDRAVGEEDGRSGDRPRMWIDRSFTIRGAGTVVTGTLTGGAFRLGDTVSIEPGARIARIRGLQSHFQTLERAEPRRRLAVNLSGVDARAVRRGDALVRPGQWHSTGVLDASLAVLHSAGAAVSGRGAFAVYTGTGEFPVRLRVLGSEREIRPGGEGAVRIWLSDDRQLVALPGDRYVLREFGRDQTVGGGEILDVEPTRPAAAARPSRSVERVIAERGWIAADHLERLTGERRPPTAGRWLIDPDAHAAIGGRIRLACEGARADGIDVAALGDLERAVLGCGVDGVTVVGALAFAAAWAPSGLSTRAGEVLAQLEKDPWSPADMPVSSRSSLRELERAGLAVQAGELWFASSAIEAAVARLGALLDDAPEGFTVSEARALLGTTRKYALPLLGLLDARGFTRRRGDRRVGGPRMGAHDTTH